jgi:hypothetical protein
MRDNTERPKIGNLGQKLETGTLFHSTEKEV